MDAVLATLLSACVSALWICTAPSLSPGSCTCDFTSAPAACDRACASALKADPDEPERCSRAIAEAFACVDRLRPLGEPTVGEP
jgi:hypothetical protein